MIAVGQDLRPPVTQLAIGGVGGGEHARVAAGLAHDRQARVVRPRVDQPAVPAPVASGPVGRREIDGGPAVHRGLPQLSLLRVGDPAAVRRDEGAAVAGPLIALPGTTDHFHPRLIEPPAQHLFPAIDHGGDEELPPVGAQADDGREGGLDARIELGVEPDQPGGRRAGGPPGEPQPGDRAKESQGDEPGRREPAAGGGVASVRRLAVRTRPHHGVGELGGRLPPVGRQLLERPRDGGIDAGWNGLPQLRHGAGLRRDDLGDDLLGGEAGERRSAGQHLVQHHAEGVDVGARVQVLTGGLLGAHVLGRAETHARLRQPTAFPSTPGQRDAEVGHHRPAVVEQDVVRLDVAVDQAMVVGVVERAGDFRGDADGIVHRQLDLALEPGAERSALDVGHYVEHRALDPARVEQGKDVGMVQVGGGLDLLEEALGSDQRRELRVHHLDGHLAIVAGVVGEEHRGHASGAQLALEEVAVGDGGLELTE